jgi:hypothetical protein
MIWAGAFATVSDTALVTAVAAGVNASASCWMVVVTVGAFELELVVSVDRASLSDAEPFESVAAAVGCDEPVDGVEVDEFEPDCGALDGSMIWLAIWASVDAGVEVGLLVALVPVLDAPVDESLVPAPSVVDGWAVGSAWTLAVGPGVLAVCVDESVACVPAAVAESESAVATAPAPKLTNRPVDSTKTPATLRKCVVKMMPSVREKPGAQ